VLLPGTSRSGCTTRPAPGKRAGFFCIQPGRMHIGNQSEARCSIDRTIASRPPIFPGICTHAAYGPAFIQSAFWAHRRSHCAVNGMAEGPLCCPDSGHSIRYSFTFEVMPFPSPLCARPAAARCSAPGCAPVWYQNDCALQAEGAAHRDDPSGWPRRSSALNRKARPGTLVGSARTNGRLIPQHSGHSKWLNISVSQKTRSGAGFLEPVAWGRQDRLGHGIDNLRPPWAKRRVIVPFVAVLRTSP
jgi:hypothetical protein